MTVTIRRPGQRNLQSRNLRGLIDYARRHAIARIELSWLDGRPTLRVWFRNGSACSTDFADPAVLREWVKTRRSWVVDELHDHLDIRPTA